MKESVFYLMVVPAIIIGENFLALFIYAFINRTTRENSTGLKILLASIAIFTITSLNYDINWTGTYRPNLNLQIIMFGRAFVCSFIALVSSVIMSNNVQNISHLKNARASIVLVGAYIAITLFIGLRENNIQPISCCGDGVYTEWGYPYRWVGSWVTEFTYMHIWNTNIYFLALIANIIFALNVGICLLPASKKIYSWFAKLILKTDPA